MFTSLQLLGRLVLLVCIGLIVFFCLEYYHFSVSALATDGKTVEFEVQQGSSLNHVAKQLDDSGVLPHSLFFNLIARLTDKTHQLKAGEYRITPGLTAKQLLHKLVVGDVIMRSVTLVEGWNIHLVLQELHESPYLTHDLKNVAFDDIREKVGVHESHLEGLFFPETYHFAKYTLESDILMRAYHDMHKHLTKAWNERDRTIPIKTPYQALIVASMVEKETAVPSERPQVAGVIYRRMNKNMRLQIDPTVIYGLGDRYDGKIHKAEIKNKNPYNTYTIHGLPPTPIAMPSESAIHAALHPDKSNAIYFMGRGDGTHEFTDNLVDHEKAVKR
ncbi:MAG: endolytic transglycosylase MltG, partial [Coxiellaceae bacterium]|nr:endolytic transglycosylase MltG [Coxiellaceae bacterium]